MKNPTQITIIGVPYQVLWVDKDTAIASVTQDTLFHTDDGEDVPITDQVVTQGYISPTEEKIVVDDSGPFYSKKVTLLHEVMHGCLGPLGKDNDEALVEGLSHILLDTFRRNPDFVAYLMEGVK